MVEIDLKPFLEETLISWETGDSSRYIQPAYEAGGSEFVFVDVHSVSLGTDRGDSSGTNTRWYENLRIYSLCPIVYQRISHLANDCRALLSLELYKSHRQY